jgi:uncharacterized protein (DUF302 family)
MLPCNVIVEEHEDGTVEVSAVNPLDSMQAVQNSSLSDIAGEVKSKLEKVIQAI